MKKWPYKPQSQIPLVNKSHTLARGLIRLWAFNEGGGTVLRDASGKKQNATINGTPLWTQSPYGRSMDFDKSDDYVDAGTINLDGKFPTISVLVKFNSFHGTFPYIQNIIGEENGSTGDLFFIRTGDATAANNDRIEAGYRIGGSNGGLQYTAADAVAGEYYLLTIVYDGANIHLYVNDKRVSTAVSGTLEAAGGFQIGRMPEGAHSGRLLDGEIAFAALWERPLTYGEVIMLNRDPFVMIRPAYPAFGKAPAAPATSVKDIIGFGIIPFAR